MNKEERKNEIERLKKIFPENGVVEYNDLAYHEFMVKKIVLPKEAGTPYLKISTDKEGNKYVVIPIPIGYSKLGEEKSKEKKKQTIQRRQERKELKESLLKEIKVTKRAVRFYSTKTDLDSSLICEKEKAKLKDLVQQYENQFARKKRE